ncbi:Gfo/Idh/MocA family protein [Oceaniglobus trochenteri]|uniref:Gfo/Idh/MocA family protein n=1 Tax=Oceaniglobus trochenteri TaxID=2763260 RepID=UPI001D000649|nr:Gfo/Idh/MocA family oxidoreductase [Oceaniglobus trochenteri]
MTKPINAGVAGLGRSGWRMHALTLDHLKGLYRVAAVTDPMPERRAEAEAAFGCASHADFAAMIAQPDLELVVIATPSHMHADMAVAALEAGKHVVVEKPLAASVADADRMIAAAKANDRVLTVGQDLRFEADFLKIREVIASGKLGRILQINIKWHWFRRRWDWQTLTKFGGGCLNNDGSHVVDQALQLFGDSDPDVFCRMARTPLTAGDAEDHVKILLSAPGAPLIDMEFSNAVAYPQEQWLITGTQGGLAGGHHKLRWRYIEPALLPVREVDDKPTPERNYNKEDLNWTEESCDLLSEQWTSKNQRMYADLYRTLREGAPLAITAESVRRQLVVLEECRRQAGPLDTGENA